MTNSTKYLFLFTIGPVQSFIAQARKTQDLYAGSQILTKLIKAGIEEIGRENIIFPYASPDNDTEWQAVKSLPNRFIATVDSPIEALKDLGESIEKIVSAKWLEIGQRHILEMLNKKISNNRSIKFDIAGINQQLEQHLEIFWLFEPLKSYQESYKNIEQKLGAIKNIRSFQQFNYNSIGERGRKCSLDGERNAFFFGAGTNPNYFGVKWNPFAIELEESNIKVAANEGLSAISFAKRFYDKSGFPSTAKIALLNLWNNKEVKREIDTFKSLFEQSTFDQELLFEDNLNKDYIKKYNIKFSTGETLTSIQTQQRKIFTKANELGLKPSKYYALLSFDGDSMGEWLSKAKDEEEHKYFSKLLIDFAQKATERVNKNGKTVYAGGDDFLGFVNLQGLFETIEGLKADFDAEVTKKVKIENGSKKFTMSMGIVIAHYKMPLGIVVKRVKEAEKAAKQNNDNKNSLAIDFITHSGNNRLGIIPFAENGQSIKNIKYINDSLKEDFSDKWIRNFAEEFYAFPNKENKMKLDDEFIPLVKAELTRLISRAYKSSGEDKKTAVKELKNNAFELLKATDFNYANFTEMLYITSALVSKTS